VYWTDGGVLSDNPAHFAIVSNNDRYLFTKAADFGPWQTVWKRHRRFATDGTWLC
jgi:hypothetical protein